MASARDMTQWARLNPNQPIAMAVAVLVIGLSAWVGLKARAAGNELAAKRAAWEQTASQLATVQQQFRVPTSTETASLISEASAMGALGVPEGEKLNIIDVVGRLAEACGLSGVRVNATASSDSAVVAERHVAGTRIANADYALAVEFVGSFANAQKFVSSLPPSVSLSRMTAARRDRGTVYQLVLSVYQLDAKPSD
jgi:hypothetical protein